MNKPAFSISDQIALLKRRGMLFKDEVKAYSLLKKISYYRLKGYWWDMQSDPVLHIFQPNVYFEESSNVMISTVNYAPSSSMLLNR